MRGEAAAPPPPPPPPVHRFVVDRRAGEQAWAQYLAPLAIGLQGSRASRPVRFTSDENLTSP